MTTKVSSAQFQQVLNAVPGTIRKLASERDFWKNKAESGMRRDEAEKVASQMHEKGIRSDVDYETLVSHLEKAAESGELAKIAAAVEMTGPDMGQKIASLTGNHDNAGASPGSGHSEFERYILGGVG